MKKITRSPLFLLILFIALVAVSRIVLVSAQIVNEKPLYNINGTALAINNLGEILIQQYNPNYLLIYSESAQREVTTLLDADIKPSNSFNDKAEITGTKICDGKYTGFVYSNNQVICFDNMIEGKIRVPNAIAINNNSQVAGYFFDDNMNSVLFVWQNGVYKTYQDSALGNFPIVTDISDNGIITGKTGRDGFTFDTNSGRATILSAAGYDLSPVSINNIGDVTGNSIPISPDGTTGPNRAFVWQNGTFKVIGTLGGSFSNGYQINDNGIVVGDSYLAGDIEAHGFAWRNNEIADLGLLDNESSQIQSTTSNSLSVNNNNLIVGTNFGQNLNDPQDVEMTPVIYEYYINGRKKPRRIRKSKPNPSPTPSAAPMQGSLR